MESKTIDPTRVIVVGTSAGGTEALEVILSSLGRDFKGCLLIVRHLAPEASVNHLTARLQKRCSLPCSSAKDGMALEEGHVYLAPADHHLLVDEEKLWVTRGARENRWRPSIDTLFRSAAVSHRNRTIGVILSGYLDDGVSGMAAIKRCGGIVIVQDPVDAEHSELPLNVLDKVDVDHCVPLNRIPEVLDEILTTAPHEPPVVPPDLAMEARISMRAVGGIDDVSAWGAPSFVTCPECGGVLWENSSGTFHRFRCHTGHAFSPDSLDAAQAGKIEQTLWIALRLFQEKHETLKKLAGDALGPQWDSMHQRMAEIEGHIRRTKEMLGII